jgi:hypothetical protein
MKANLNKKFKKNAGTPSPFIFYHISYYITVFFAQQAFDGAKKKWNQHF